MSDYKWAIRLLHCLPLDKEYLYLYERKHMTVGEHSAEQQSQFPNAETVAVRCQRIQQAWDSRERAIRRLRGWGIDVPASTPDRLLEWFRLSPSRNPTDHEIYVI